jgi:RNA polymerase sigma-70 factor (ECF subfamily)
MTASSGQPPGDTHELVDHLFRARAGQMVAWLTRVFGPAHLDLAEEVVQDALLKALSQWPFNGVPDNPGGWLFRVARNGALDVLRRNAAFRDREAAIARELTRLPDTPDPLPSSIEDDELRMVFMCCHPDLPADARVALSLKTVGGFSVQEIGGAFLTAPSTIAQRLVRAKRLIREQRIGLDLPHESDLVARLDSVLEVIYLLFNEGYNAHAGDDLIRQDLCGEAIRLGRLVAGHPAVAAPASHALVAMMAFQAARLGARVDQGGELVLLEDQDRSLWDRRLIALGFAHFERSADGPRLTTYHLQAAIAAIHATAATPGDTRWTEVLELYDDLMRVNPSPVIALNRAVALARVKGPSEALAAVAAIEDDPSLANYYLLPSVKGRLLSELGDRPGAAACYREALARPCTEPERRFLLRQLQRLQADHSTAGLERPSNSPC